MCISPSQIWIERGPNWEPMPVPCKKCWRCKQNRVNDYVARVMAEASTSLATCAITLTYAPREDLADKVLTPSHFQLFMKLLRRAGHKIRYFVAGEYGDLKGRAHFHAILFFTEFAQGSGPIPEYNPSHMFNSDSSARFCRQVPSQKNVHIREWPHGHVRADWAFSERAARYVAKYLLAENKNNAWFSLSKKPALGHAWFQNKAAIARELGVLPSSFNYLPPGGDKNRPYFMSGATRRDYLNAITQDEKDIPRMSEWTANVFDKYFRQRRDAEFDAMTWDEYLAAKEASIQNTQPGPNDDYDSGPFGYNADTREEASEYFKSDLENIQNHAKKSARTLYTSE